MFVLLREALNIDNETWIRLVRRQVGNALCCMHYAVIRTHWLSHTYDPLLILIFLALHHILLVHSVLDKGSMLLSNCLYAEGGRKNTGREKELRNSHRLARVQL